MDKIYGNSQLMPRFSPDDSLKEVFGDVTLPSEK
jgi:hypothetical protein